MAKKNPANQQPKKPFLERVSERVDDLVAVFSPRAAGLRKAYRQVAKLAAYRAAGKDRLHANWLGTGGSADADLLPELSSLRERSRDLNRNDGVASGVTNTVVVNTVGTGIRPQSRVDADSIPGATPELVQEFQRVAERNWQRWVRYADVQDRLTFYDMQALIQRQILENGEVIVLKTMLKEPFRPFMTAYEIIEADRLETPSDQKSNPNIRDGVELGSRGEPVAYWIRKAHPGELSVQQRSKREYVRIPARDRFGNRLVHHLYWQLRPGQTRGMPFFTPVMTRFKDMADYLEAEIVAARVAACFAIFVKKTDPLANAIQRTTQTNARSQRVEEVEPGMIEYLAPGEEIESAGMNRPGNTFDPFMDRVLRMIASALGLPYELVVKDFSKTNYSSARAALLEARRFFKFYQEWISTHYCQDAWDAVLEEGVLRGDFAGLTVGTFFDNRLDWTRARWIAPGWGWVDPTKEVEASVKAVQGNLSTYSDECAALGRDFDEVVDQRKREQQRIQEAGLNPAPTEKAPGDGDGEDGNGNPSEREPQDAEPARK